MALFSINRAGISGFNMAMIGIVASDLGFSISVVVVVLYLTVIVLA